MYFIIYQTYFISRQIINTCKATKSFKNEGPSAVWDKEIRASRLVAVFISKTYLARRCV